MKFMCQQCGNDTHCGAELADCQKAREFAADALAVVERRRDQLKTQLTEAVQILRDFGGMGRGEWIAARARFLANTVK